ncbi:hypothetical protein HOC80_03235 [archaeon]|jgi:hypothetical protein|nr:hypothetical protein [archaeon]MBT4417092.1 hypothetical protein [archaeon]
MRRLIIDKLVALTTAAFGLVAALAWNDTIKAIFATVFGEQSNVPAMIVYAVVVTIMAVIVTVYIARIEAKTKN